MVKLLIITIVAAVLSLVESADKCNENFLIFMLNSVCSLNKRSFSPDGSKIWSALEKNLNDFERKYKEMMASAEEEELLFGKPMYKTKSQERNTMRPRPMHLSIYADMMSRKMSKPSSTV